MAVLLLVRHGTTDLTGKRLYGRSGGIHISAEGRRQAERVAERLRPLRLAAVYTSPIERCAETAEVIADACGVPAREEAGLMELDYGRWTGRPFGALSRTRLWRLAHRVPSSVTFPEGEAMADAQRRVVDALGRIAERHPRGVVGAVSHGDPIAMALAHYAGVHFDLFQRFAIAPGSVSAVAIRDGAPTVLRVNDTGTLDDLRPPRRSSS